jgi:hypothetical protein
VALLAGASGAIADPMVVGDVTQTPTNLGSVSNDGIKDVGALNGIGSSASISATGAAASASVSEIGNNGNQLHLTMGNVQQTANNGEIGDVNGISVTNNGDLDQIGNLHGDGTSLSISATGAVSALSGSFNNSLSFDQISIATGVGESITQESRNRGRVTNTNSEFSSIDTGNIEGDGASIGVSATGAATVVSLTSIQNSGAGAFIPDVDTGDIGQTSANSGTILNNGGLIRADNINGKGSSISIGSTGAVAAVSLTSINDADAVNSVNTGNITQTATNYGGVTNTGNIQLGTSALGGNGASTSISATGAVAAVSLSLIK